MTLICPKCNGIGEYIADSRNTNSYLYPRTFKNPCPECHGECTIEIPDSSQFEVAKCEDVPGKIIAGNNELWYFVKSIRRIK